MGLTYYYRFRAAGSCDAETLSDFLREVEELAKDLGFGRTRVLNVRFQSQEEREFSRSLGAAFVLESDALKGSVYEPSKYVYAHNRNLGSARLFPSAGVILVVTDEHKRESCFGFLKFPTVIVEGHVLLAPWAEDWVFHDFVNTPDPRFRKIVDAFRKAGFLEEERDDYS